MTDIQFIPSRRCVGFSLLGLSDNPTHTWSKPFWSITIQTANGEYLHASLDPSSATPRLGDPMSLVARATGPLRSRRMVLSILRPPLRLARG